MYNFQIPLQNCISKNIFCIDQFLLILQKVVEDYYTTNKGTVKVIGLLRIAKQFLKMSIALLEYIESSNEYNLMIEINKIEEIKRYIINKYYFSKNLVKKNIEIYNIIFITRKIQENIIFIIDNIQYNNKNLDGSERYLWSAFENVMV